MKIVYLLLHDFRFASVGIEEFARRRFHFSKEYARRLALLGHEVALYVLSDEISSNQVIEVDGYKLKAFKSSFRFPPHIRFGNAHSLEAMEELDRDSPDVVHFHNYYLWNFPYVALWVKRKRTPLVAQYHGSDPIRSLKAFWYSPSLRLCDSLLVPLRSEERLMTRQLRIPTNRVLRFPSTGVETRDFHPVGKKRSELTFLYSGRIPKPASYRWEKAPIYLIPILRALMDQGTRPRLIIAGDGPGLPDLERAAKQFNVQDSIDFLGHVEHEKLPELYSRATMTFVPFKVEEIGPRWDGALQESLACGTPVAAFNDDSPGLQKFGVLIPTEPVAAARLIQGAVNNPAWMASVAKDGPELIRGNCEWSVLARRLDSGYSQLAGLSQ